MWRALAFVAALVLAFVTLHAHPNHPIPSSELPLYEDEDAYDVYAAALPLWRPHQEAIREAKQLIIHEEIIGRGKRTAKELGIRFSRGDKRDWEPVLAAFVRENENSRRLVPSFPMDIPYRLVSNEELAANFREERPFTWKKFFVHYPGANGLLRFSAVGFNADKTRAVVNIHHNCGGLCGGARPHFLEKKNGKWAEATVDVEYRVIAY